MASYATVPAEAEAEKPLLNRDVRVNLKTVIGGAAVASFLLGALAAAVVSGAPARTNSNFAAAVAPHRGTKHWTCEAPFLDTTVTAFVDEKWYQSSFKLAICTAGC